MSKLKMPAKGSSAAMLAKLQAEHAATIEEEDEQALAKATGSGDGSRKASARRSSSPSSEATRQQRVALALERAGEDEMMVVTVRVPCCLNHYLEEYVARRRSLDPKSRYRKQDAVAEAFAAFYADHPLPPLPADGNVLQ